MPTEVVVNVLNEDGTPKTSEELDFERQQIIAAGDTPIIPGSKTDSALLLQSLKDTRAKLKDSEEKLRLATLSPASPDINTEEGKALQLQIDEAKARISELTQQGAVKDLYLEFPVLKEKSADFEKYLVDPENAGMSLKTSARAFLVENGLAGARRPGLEKPTGGDRLPPPSTAMTVDEIRILRETNFKKYVELLNKGLIKVPN